MLKGYEIIDLMQSSKPRNVAQHVAQVLWLGSLVGPAPVFQTALMATTFHACTIAAQRTLTSGSLPEADPGNLPL